MCCCDEIMGLNDADFSLRSCDSMWGVYEADVFWKSLAQTVPLLFIVLPGFTPASAATLVSPGFYSLLDGKRQLRFYFTGSVTLLAAAPWAATWVMLPGCPLGKKRLPSVHPPLPSNSASCPIPNTQHHPAFQGVSITSCCVNLPRLLLFWCWYKSRPSPPASVRGYRCHTHWWENSQDFCIHLLHIFALALFCFAFFQWERNKKAFYPVTTSRSQCSNAVLCHSMPSLHLCITAMSLELCFKLTARHAFLNLGNF